MTHYGKYNGDWQEDKKHGFGVSIDDKEQIYEGEWNMGLQHGKGKLTSFTGKDGNGSD